MSSIDIILVSVGCFLSVRLFSHFFCHVLNCWVWTNATFLRKIILNGIYQSTITDISLYYFAIKKRDKLIVTKLNCLVLGNIESGPTLSYPSCQAFHVPHLCTCWLPIWYDCLPNRDVVQPIKSRARYFATKAVFTNVQPKTAACNIEVMHQSCMALSQERNPSYWWIWNTLANLILVIQMQSNILSPVESLAMLPSLSFNKCHRSCGMARIRQHFYVESGIFGWRHETVTKQAGQWNSQRTGT